MADRSKRYENSPKGTQTAEAEAKKTAGGKNAPHEPDPGPVGKVGEDKGPEAGKDAEFGVVAQRHTREHGDMVKRHAEEANAMHERHGKEGKDLHKRHGKEMQDHMEGGAEKKVEASAGSPKELGKDKDEGKKGAEV